ncbi:LysM peptidoglycan-binding domain-containing protein [Leifsonia sp. AG29]|uniref:LysM peptidoglycan-binding domain-containing protein n=1 Tax=Leifsonia sp. AG29 TaxID=2598860 RepID=UPI001E2E03ED|nr:LysM domain-containing protein [Leifsonia sp. AG29]
MPTGTVVAEGDVASPKGSIHFHYRIVSDGDNTYSAQYSRFTSTVPIPVSVTLLEIPPRVGDGLTFHGVGDHLLGGPTSGAASSVGPIEEGQPSYLKALVTYSSASASDDVPQELGPDKVLAVNTVRWSVPVRQSNVHTVDGGARPNAMGTVSATTAAGAPKHYDVAQGDTTDAVAARFGITVQDLVWLNSDLGTITGAQTLYASTRLNLDPDSL